MTGLVRGISVAGSAADTSRAFGGWGLLAVDVAYRIIARLHYVRFMFLFGSGVNGGQQSPAGGTILDLQFSWRGYSARARA
jgi:hypothetical protein